MFKPFGSFLALLLLAVVSYGQTCASQNFVNSSPGQFYSGIESHVNGYHDAIWNFNTSCSYFKQAGVDSGICNTNQATAAFFSTNDSGTVSGSPIFFHQVKTSSQVRLASAQKAGTVPADTNAGLAVQSCPSALGCAAITISVAPFSVSGNMVIAEQGPLTWNSGCPAKSYSIKTPCTCSQCGCGSPLMIDIGPKGGGDIYQLTNIKDGISFDLKNSGVPEKIAWTKPGSNFAVLVLPDENGEIKNSRQLFGNFTPQPVVKTCGASKHEICPRNGIIALSVYDSPKKGGNGNGMIDKNDAIYYKLRLLLGKPADPNHRLLTLPEANIESISLAYQPTEQFEDSFGNLYKFETVVTTSPVAGNTYGNRRWMYDVWLMNERLGDIPGAVDIRK